MGEYLFNFNNILRDFRDWFDDTARLSAVRDHFTVLIQEYEAQFPAEKRDRVRLNYYLHRGETHRILARYSEALADSKQAESLQLDIAARAQAERGEYDQAELTAMTLAQAERNHGPYLAAQASAYMAAVVKSDGSLTAARREELAEKYSRQAVQWLQKAQGLRYLASPSTRYLLADDRDLDPLRSRDDFRALLAQAKQTPRTGK